MNVVHELVTNIDHLETLYERLRTLGLFHVRNQVPSRYLDIMGPIFCNAVRPILLSHDVWSPEVEESWMEVFKVLTMVMKTWQARSAPESPGSTPRSRRTGETQPSTVKKVPT